MATGAVLVTGTSSGIGYSIAAEAVTDAIRELIALAPGKRPIRTTVGLDLRVGEPNRAAAPFQHDYLRAMGLGETEVLAGQEV
jgi:hypothetical protein